MDDEDARLEGDAIATHQATHTMNPCLTLCVYLSVRHPYPNAGILLFRSHA